MHYVITVQGYLEDHWSAWFDGLTITNAGNGQALLAGTVLDQAALHGLIVKIRDLGLPLIAVVPGCGHGDAGIDSTMEEEPTHVEGNS